MDDRKAKKQIEKSLYRGQHITLSRLLIRLGVSPRELEKYQLIQNVEERIQQMEEQVVALSSAQEIAYLEQLANSHQLDLQDYDNTGRRYKTPLERLEDLRASVSTGISAKIYDVENKVPKPKK